MDGKVKPHGKMKKRKRVILIDYDNPCRIYAAGISSGFPSFSERMRAYRCMAFKKGFVSSRYRGMSGIFRLLIQIVRNEMMSLFRLSQQHDTLNEHAAPEFERWAKAMEGLQERPQCGQGSEDMADSSLRKSSSDGR